MSEMLTPEEKRKLRGRYPDDHGILFLLASDDARETQVEWFVEYLHKATAIVGKHAKRIAELEAQVQELRGAAGEGEAWCSEDHPLGRWTKSEGIRKYLESHWSHGAVCFRPPEGHAMSTLPSASDYRERLCTECLLNAHLKCTGALEGTWWLCDCLCRGGGRDTAIEHNLTLRKEVGMDTPELHKHAVAFRMLCEDTVLLDELARFHWGLLLLHNSRVGQPLDHPADIEVTSWLGQDLLYGGITNYALTKAGDVVTCEEGELHISDIFWGQPGPTLSEMWFGGSSVR